MRRAAPFFLFASIVLAPTSAFAFINLNSGGGFLFDIAEPADFSPVGTMSNGTSDAYDTCYQLAVGGITYDPPSGSPIRTLADRQLEMPVQDIAGLSVKRIIYVPSSGGDYARYLEVLENTSASPISTTVTVSGNLGSDGSTMLTATSSGDLLLTTADNWFATDDTDGSGDPSLAHVFQGSSSTLRATSVSLSFDNITYSWNVTVPARSRIAILHFAVQTLNRAAAMAEAVRLAEGPDDALVGIDDYLDEIQTFGASSPGAPRVRFTGPFSADEGAAITIEAAVEDLEGDTFTFSWDLDDDGTFGEMPGATSATIPAGTTDGPGTVRVGVRATDSRGNAVDRYRSIQIMNLDPEITSSPPLTTSVGVDLRYTLAVTDPAGALDPLSYTLARGPERMTITPAGVVQWTPTETDVTRPGETLTIEVVVSDGDEGTDSQSWEMVVSPNRAPTAPVPAYPIDNVGIIDPTPRLAAANAQDLDLDTLTYHFELDTVSTFDSAELRTSGPITETPGFTAWQITEPLEENRMYFWRVRANDGSIDGEARASSFWVVRDPSLPPPDAGVRADGGTGPDSGVIPGLDAGITPPPSGGCSAGGTGSNGVAWALALFALLFARRRVRG